MRRIWVLSHLAAIGVIAATVAGVTPAQAGRPGCGFPGSQWSARSAPSLGLDADKLQEALDFATTHAGASVLVLRHGCLAGVSRLDPITSEVPLDGWSMTKSVTALLVGRAVTMGRLDIDRPIARYFPEADRAHGHLTPRQLMHMASGLHLHWTRDFHGPSLHPDRVRDALSLPFDHKPGTYWEYHQSPVTLLGETVARAVGRDLQSFAQQHLFSPLDIERGSWSWERDRAGNTEAWAHLKLRSLDWARLGTLVLHRGNWRGRQLISREYMRQMVSSSPSNHAYGFLTWLNGKDSIVLPGVNGRDESKEWLIPNAPKDTIVFAGQDEQRVWIIPSLDMVVVRLGQRGSRELDMRVSVWTARSGEMDNGLLHRIKLAVTDERLDTRDRYESAGFVMPSTGVDSWHGSLQDPVQTLAGAGIGPYAPPGCSPLGCG